MHDPLNQLPAENGTCREICLRTACNRERAITSLHQSPLPFTTSPSLPQQDQ